MLVVFEDLHMCSAEQKVSQSNGAHCIVFKDFENLCPHKWDLAPRKVAKSLQFHRFTDGSLEILKLALLITSCYLAECAQVESV